MADDPTMTEALTRQMSGQWHGLMRLVTQRGGSREDIMEMALSVSSVVLTQTADALWQADGRNRGPIPREEFDTATRFTELEAIITNALGEIRGRKGEG